VRAAEKALNQEIARGRKQVVEYVRAYRDKKASTQ
jgi:hypothetical protein